MLRRNIKATWIRSLSGFIFSVYMTCGISVLLLTFFGLKIADLLFISVVQSGASVLVTLIGFLFIAIFSSFLKNYMFRLVANKKSSEIALISTFSIIFILEGFLLEPLVFYARIFAPGAIEQALFACGLVFLVSSFYGLFTSNDLSSTEGVIGVLVILSLIGSLFGFISSLMGFYSSVLQLVILSFSFLLFTILISYHSQSLKRSYYQNVNNDENLFRSGLFHCMLLGNSTIGLFATILRMLIVLNNNKRRD